MEGSNSAAAENKALAIRLYRHTKVMQKELSEALQSEAPAPAPAPRCVQPHGVQINPPSHLSSERAHFNFMCISRSCLAVFLLTDDDDDGDGDCDDDDGDGDDGDGGGDGDDDDQMMMMMVMVMVMVMMVMLMVMLMVVMVMVVL